MICDFDCFNCKFPDCHNNSPPQAWELKFAEASGLTFSHRKKYKKSQKRKERAKQEKPDMALAEKLKSARKVKKLSQVELGKLVGKSQMQISFYELGKTKFDPSIFNGILWEAKDEKQSKRRTCRNPKANCGD